MNKTCWIESEAGEGDRDGIGGRPHLRNGEWPVCTHDQVVTAGGPARCPRFGKSLTHFFRFDVRPEWGLPFPAGTHFSFFQCVACADSVIPPDTAPPWQLPERFWEGGKKLQGNRNYTNYNWWYASMEPPGTALLRANVAEPLIRPASLGFSPEGAGTTRTIKVGGEPDWLQDPESYRCSCGSPMAFLCQVSEECEFVTLPGAPEQSGTYSSTNYMIFLGNQAYFFACPRACNARAVIPACQG